MWRGIRRSPFHQLRRQMRRARRGFGPRIGPGYGPRRSGCCCLPFALLIIALPLAAVTLLVL